MKTKLPTFNIQGTEFAVDVAKQQLVQVENPQNRISFLEMEDHGTHYSFEYNPEQKSIRSWPDKGIEVNVPQMVELDPLGMATHYGFSTEDLKWKTDFDVVVNQKLIQQRVNGLLPVIDIAAHPFMLT